MIDLAALDSHWMWLILAVLFGIGEIVIPGVFLLWIAIAAALTGGIAMLTGIAIPAQIILFAVLCLIATYAGKRWYRDHPVASQDPLLNDRAARLVGETVTVVEAIRGGQGRVKLGDSVWPCRGPDADEGTVMRVTGVNGNALFVESV
ncbi:NfeD family protein [Sphingobium algorifonticola]|uniref:NfeD family protein n=1 Tax=Sphingobium algorifonticola TaxID=2008318 RepID=A0A437JA91_9SPHN|nr:NfeD family protein [Sphingobium algorifonticola]RVT42222.1 NfeD family protein [Sphingobium algorifonticola]